HLCQGSHRSAGRGPDKVKAFTVDLGDPSGIVALRIDYSGVAADDTRSVCAEVSSQVTGKVHGASSVRLPWRSAVELHMTFRELPVLRRNKTGVAIGQKV